MSSPPAWINREFIQNALRRGGDNGEITAVSLKVDNACTDGSGFRSKMFRVKSRYTRKLNRKEEEKSLIIKISLDSGVLKNECDSSNSFETESLMLSEVMPQIHNLLKAVEGNKFSPLTAKCFDHGKQPTDYIVLEDLVASGFRLADAGKPLDLYHCSLVLRSYGRLHAASAFFLRQQPKYGELLDKDNLVEASSQDFNSALFSKYCLSAANELKKQPGYEKYVDKYIRAADTVMGRVVETIRRQKMVTRLTVLTHSDCWKNNMMFKYSGQQVSDVRLVDFQISNFNSPVRDLLYFLYSSASLEVHRDHLDTLLAEYHSTLVATLRALGMHDAADEYPLEQLNKDMDDCLVVGMIYMLINASVLTAEKFGSEMEDSFNNLDQPNDVFDRSYDNPYSTSYLKYHTLILESKGIL